MEREVECKCPHHEGDSAEEEEEGVEERGDMQNEVG